MLERFNKTFGVSGPLRRLELETLLVELYGSYHISKFPSYDGNPAEYNCHAKENWGAFAYNTNIDAECTNIEDALCSLYLEIYGKGSILAINDDIRPEDFDEIPWEVFLRNHVREIYER